MKRKVYQKSRGIVPLISYPEGQATVDCASAFRSPFPWDTCSAEGRLQTTVSGGRRTFLYMVTRILVMLLVHIASEKEAKKVGVGAGTPHGIRKWSEPVTRRPHNVNGTLR